MISIKRMSHIRLFLDGDNTYSVLDKKFNELVSSKENYFIYMRDARFHKGKITGKYLGELKENSPILTDKNKEVVIDFDGKFYVDNLQVKKARMVAINNKNKTLIIISE